jgi:hypothetical protein
VIFDTLTLSGELSMRQATFPYVFLQYSKVGGVFDLKDSRAHCAYHIRQSEIGDLVAVNSGFDTSAPTRAENTSSKSPSDAAKTDNGIQGGLCNYSKIASSPGAFIISDTRVKSTLCLRSFNWAVPNGNVSNGSGFITLKDVIVGTTAAIDLERDPKSLNQKDIHTGKVL